MLGGGGNQSGLHALKNLQPTAQGGRASLEGRDSLMVSTSAHKDSRFVYFGETKPPQAYTVAMSSWNKPLNSLYLIYYYTVPNLQRDSPQPPPIPTTPIVQ